MTNSVFIGGKLIFVNNQNYMVKVASTDIEIYMKPNVITKMQDAGSMNTR